MVRKPFVYALIVVIGLTLLLSSVDNVQKIRQIQSSSRAQVAQMDRESMLENGSKPNNKMLGATDFAAGFFQQLSQAMSSDVQITYVQNLDADAYQLSFQGTSQALAKLVVWLEEEETLDLAGVKWRYPPADDEMMPTYLTVQIRGH